jgi:hypothetical protein
VTTDIRLYTASERSPNPTATERYKQALAGLFNQTNIDHADGWLRDLYAEITELKLAPSYDQRGITIHPIDSFATTQPNQHVIGLYVDSLRQPLFWLVANLVEMAGAKFGWWYDVVAIGDDDDLDHNIVSQWLDLEVNAPDELYNLGGFTLRVSLLDARGYELTTDTKVSVPAGTPLASAAKMQRVLMIHAKALCDTENRYKVETVQQENPNAETGYTGIFYYQRDTFDIDAYIRWELYSDGWRGYGYDKDNRLEPYRRISGATTSTPPSDTLHKEVWRLYLNRRAAGL